MKHTLAAYPDLLNVADHVAYFQPGLLTRNPFLLKGGNPLDDLDQK